MYYYGLSYMRKSTIIDGMILGLGLSWKYMMQIDGRRIKIYDGDNAIIATPDDEQDAIIFLSGYKAAVDRTKTLKQIVLDSRIKIETTRGVSATTSKLIKALGRFF